MELCISEWEFEKQPIKVTVLMSVYNGEQYLREAIDSILEQTLTNFEFLIINDASTDESKKIIQSYQDNRIRLIDNIVNMGLTKSLNRGIDLARGEYIARMDADDISLPERLEQQARLMDEQHEIGICGCWVKTFGTIHNKWKYPVDHDEIISQLLFKNALAHSAVMLRRQYIYHNNLRYDESFKYAQDYEFWVRCSKTTKITNIPRILMKYRISELQITQKYLRDQAYFAQKSRKEMLNNFGIVANDEVLRIHNNICEGIVAQSNAQLYEYEQWLKFLKDKRLRTINRDIFNKTIYAVWLRVCSESARVNIVANWLLMRSCLSNNRLDSILRGAYLLFRYIISTMIFHRK